MNGFINLALLDLFDAHARLAPFAHEQTDDNLAKARDAVHRAINNLARKAAVKESEVAGDGISYGASRTIRLADLTRFAEESVAARIKELEQQVPDLQVENRRLHNAISEGADAMNMLELAQRIRNILDDFDR